ncbi:MAG: LON peptidase substrate-binding domain-containing protein [Verrucomicrobia bacterium]|nr:LON peptidase substrate-binding domain-containing protein [Verrucomicrobiota bacterium]
MVYPKSIPVMMLPSITLFPNTMLPLHIYEPRYCRMLHRSLQNHRLMAITIRKPEMVREMPHKTAGLGMIRAAVRHADGTAHIILQGVARIRLQKATSYKPFRVHSYDLLETKRGSEKRIQSLRQKLVDLVSMHLEQGKGVMQKIKSSFSECNKDIGGTSDHPSMEGALVNLVQIQDVEQLANLVSCTFISKPQARQLILEESDLESRLTHLVAFLMGEIFCRKRKGKA